jgi:hypothetical protein
LFLAFYSDVSINKEKVEFGTPSSTSKKKKYNCKFQGEWKKITPLVTVKFVGK